MKILICVLSVIAPVFPLPENWDSNQALDTTRHQQAPDWQVSYRILYYYRTVLIVKIGCPFCFVEAALQQYWEGYYTRVRHAARENEVPKSTLCGREHRWLPWAEAFQHRPLPFPADELTIANYVCYQNTCQLCYGQAHPLPPGKSISALLGCSRRRGLAR